AHMDEFTNWCFEAVEAIGGTVDVPTFVCFLKEVESPFEVNDYVRSYLGDTREARDFCRDFVERRSRWKNSRKEKDDDSLCRPASAVNPNQNEFQEVKVRKSKGGRVGMGSMSQAHANDDEGDEDSSTYQDQQEGFVVVSETELLRQNTFKPSFSCSLR